MSGRIILFFICLILIMQTADALSTTMKSNYLRSETIVARLDGQILNSISSNQIEFKRGTTRVPFESTEIKKLGNNYYLLAITPENAGNYTLLIYNVATPDNPSPHTYTQNFYVSSNLSEYYIKPGALISSGDFSITVHSNKDANQQIITDFPQEKEINIYSGDNFIQYNSLNKPAGLNTFKLGTYEVVLYLTTGTNTSTIINQTQNITTNITENLTLNNTSNVANSSLNVTSNASINNTTNSSLNVTSNASINNTTKKMLMVDPTIINKIALLGSNPVYNFLIKNTGNESIDSIEIKYNEKIINLTFKNGSSLESNKSYLVEFSFPSELNDTIKTDIIFKYGSNTLTLPIQIDLTKNISIILNRYSTSSTNKSENRKSIYYCSELSGKICTAGNICSGTNVSGKDGLCCLGKCVAKPVETSYSWIGWLIAGIVVLGIAFVWSKYSGVKPATNPLLSEKVKKNDLQPNFKINAEKDFKKI